MLSYLLLGILFGVWGNNFKSSHEQLYFDERTTLRVFVLYLDTLPKVSSLPCPTYPVYLAQGIRHTLPKSQSTAPIGKKISMGENKDKLPSS